jgi:hypothetical protein
MRTLVDFIKLELFRDLNISLSDLNNSGKTLLYNSETTNGDKVIVCVEHVINVLNKLKEKRITQLDLIQWIYTIRFSDLFEFCEDQHEIILNIFDEIAETTRGNYAGSAQGFSVTHTDILNILDGNILEELIIVKKISESDIDKYIAHLSE